MDAPESPVYLYYDLETTGFSPSLHRICQIAFVLRVSSQLQKFCSLVNPECEIPVRAQEVHGISTEASSAAPLFADVWAQARDWLSRFIEPASNVCLVGHNSWRFDDAFLQAETARCGRRITDLSTTGSIWSMDTLVMYREQRKATLHGQKAPKECMRLGTLYQRLIGTELMGAHDALVDCMAVAEVHAVLLERDRKSMLVRKYDSMESFKRALDRLDDLRCSKKPCFPTPTESVDPQDALALLDSFAFPEEKRD